MSTPKTGTVMMEKKLTATGVLLVQQHHTGRYCTKSHFLDHILLTGWQREMPVSEERKDLGSLVRSRIISTSGESGTKLQAHIESIL